MAKKFKRKNNKIKRFWNKRTQDLTVGETIVYGLAASVAALGISIIPLAIIGAIENKEPKKVEIPVWNLPTVGEATEDTEETEEL